MQYSQGYLYGLKLLNSNYSIEEIIDGKVVTWTLKESGVYKMKCTDYINCGCIQLAIIIRWLKNPSSFTTCTTAQRDALDAEDHCYYVYNSDTSTIDTWAVATDGSWSWLTHNV